MVEASTLADSRASKTLLEVTVVPAIVLGVWGIFAVLVALIDAHSFYSGNGVLSLFSGLHNGSSGPLGGYDYGWVDSPLGRSGLNLFILVPLSVLALSVAALVRSEPRLVRLAGQIAVGSILLASFFWVPIRNGYWGPQEFIIGSFLAGLLPVAGLLFAYKSGSVQLTNESLGSETGQGADGVPITQTVSPALSMLSEGPVGQNLVVQRPPGSYPGQPVFVTSRTNGFAIAALVLGIIGVSVLAIVFGHVARSKIHRSGEKGQGMATAGLVLGYIWLALSIAYFVALAVVIRSLVVY